MNHLKKLLSAAAVMLALLLVRLPMTPAAHAAELPEPDAELLYVTDNAGVLSSSLKSYLVERNETLYSATGAQFAVLTVDALPGGYDCESYSYAVFNAWGIGSAEKNNGLLLVLVPHEGKFWMTVGEGLQSSLTGGVLTELLDDYLADDFDNGRYDDGVRAVFDAVWQKLEDIYGPIETAVSSAAVSPSSTARPSAPASSQQPAAARPQRRSSFLPAVLLVLLVLIVLTALLRPRRRYYGGRRTPPPPPPGVPPYYRTYTHRPPPAPPRPARRPPSSGGFGGGPAGWMGGGRPSGSRPAGGSGSRRPSGGFGSSRPSSGFGGGHSSGGFGGGRSSGSFGGGRSHGGGGGRR